MVPMRAVGIVSAGLVNPFEVGLNSSAVGNGDIGISRVVGEFCSINSDLFQEQQDSGCVGYDRRGTCSFPFGKRLVSMSEV